MTAEDPELSTDSWWGPFLILFAPVLTVTAIGIPLILLVKAVL